MAGVKWIKISTDMFNNPKIKFIRTLPEGNDIVLIWAMILCRAGTCNAGGYIFLTEDIPYTDEALANEFGIGLNTIKLALQTFEKLNMVTRNEQGFACILGWNEHQNAEKLEEIREYNRLAKQKSREKQKLLSQNTVNDNVNDSQGEKQGRQCTDTDKDKDIDKDKDKDKERIPWQDILTAWNQLPQPIKQIKAITKLRQDKVNARIKGLNLNIQDVFTAINNIKGSLFLQGENQKNWVIDFDWMFKDDTRFSKVFENKYSDTKKKNFKKESTFNDYEQRKYDGSDGGMTISEIEEGLLGN